MKSSVNNGSKMGKNVNKRILLIGTGILIAVLVISLFLGWKAFRTAERIQIENPENATGILSLFPGEERVPLRGETRGRVNILLLGRAGEKYPGKNLTDTVMVASIDTVGRRAGFLSLPRDLYAPIGDTGLYTKLNSLYQYGLSQDTGTEPVRKAVEHITGLDIPYFVILDFDGFERIIDDLGGIRVENPRDILDTRYPGKNYSYETFELPAGWHTLDGATTLRYVRERHDDPEGDFGRAKRQQQVIKAAREKAFSLPTFLNIFTVNRMLDTLGDSVRTNLSIAEIGSLIELGKTIDLRNASTVVIDAWKKESLLRVDHVQVGPIAAFILVPRTGNWNEIRELADDLFAQDEIRKRRDMIAAEKPHILVVFRPEQSGIGSRLARTIKDTLGTNTVDTLSIASLEKNQESAIIGVTGAEKPYTEDELLKTFSLGRSDTAPPLPAGSRSAKDADFIIVLGADADEIAISNTTLEETASDGSSSQDDPFSDFLEPQKR